MPADPDGNYFYPTAILIIIILYVLTGLYAYCESYFQNINEKKLKKDADSGNAKALKMLKLLEKREARFSPIQFGLIFNGLLVSSVSVAVFLNSLCLKLIALGNTAAFWLSVIIIAVASSLIFFIFADLIPKKLALHRVDTTKYRSYNLINTISLIFAPYLFIVNFITDGVLRFFGFDPKNLIETVTEDEIIMLVGESEEKGVIEENEKDMIENILDFNDTTVSEIMTHRTDIHAVSDVATIDELVELSVEEGVSRIPVFHEDIDSVVGICYVKDLLPYVGKELPKFLDIKNFIRPAYFIPESKLCSHLFNELTERKVQIAIIVDEYGGTSGLITLEDLIESILGNIQDEYDNEEEDIVAISDNAFTVDGTTSIDEISDLTDTELPEGDYDTIAGLVTEQLGRILRDDEHPSIEIMGLEITVLEVEEQRIAKLLVRKLEKEQEDFE